jgi:hypothetical protein
MLLELVQAAVAAESGWTVYVTPASVVAVGTVLGRVLWRMHLDQSKDRTEWLSQMGKVDMALRGYDGEGGMLYDLRAIREARHSEASTISTMQTQLAELRLAVATLNHRIERAGGNT